MTERIRSAAQVCVIAQQIDSRDLDGLRHLRERRRRLGDTQLQMAEKVGVRKGTYQAWEACRAWPSSCLLPQLAVAMKCTMEELYLPPED